MANFSNSDPINRDDVTPHNMYDNAWTTYNVPRTQLTHDNDLDSVLPNQEQRADIWGSYGPKLEPPTINMAQISAPEASNVAHDAPTRPYKMMAPAYIMQKGKDKIFTSLRPR